MYPELFNHSIFDISDLGSTPPSSEPTSQRRRTLQQQQDGTSPAPGGPLPMSSEIDLSSPMTYATSPGSVRTPGPSGAATPRRKRTDITGVASRREVALTTDGSGKLSEIRVLINYSNLNSRFFLGSTQFFKSKKNSKPTIF